MQLLGPEADAAQPRREHRAGAEEQPSPRRAGAQRLEIGGDAAAAQRPRHRRIGARLLEALFGARPIEQPQRPPHRIEQPVAGAVRGDARHHPAEITALAFVGEERQVVIMEPPDEQPQIGDVVAA